MSAIRRRQEAEGEFRLDTKEDFDKGGDTGGGVRRASGEEPVIQGDSI